MGKLKPCTKWVVVAALLQRAESVSEDMPWRHDFKFAPIRVIHFEGSDGLARDAFLTVPAHAGKLPMVAEPGARNCDTQ